MAIQAFERLISNTTDVFLATSRDQAASNAANNIGNHPDLVPRFPTWPSLDKFDNDTIASVFSPFGGVPNPDYIWDQPASDGQTVAFAVATPAFVTFDPTLRTTFSIFLAAFADNAMEAKIEMFEEIDGTFVKSAPQPSGLGDVLFVAGEPNNPAVGLTIDSPPFTFQDIRIYSTRFELPPSRLWKIVVSFEVTNYLQQPIYSSNPSSLNNPAGLQFMVDIYQNIELI
ncbi:hypothetical protein [Peribacillus simplex]|uniref:Uncharacterized protein n=1 Tax=Peribacillus simplex TaxID=1478 RepID=A0A9W4PJ04_9BACI|nr:hypothetical protein [Peribacillus simplex]WHX90590.1 hypothetical protein QNH50_21690 [Peribacillus simplex]CAH0306449.1 hypothetical protein SRABI133_04758 [Peribacillus simplex]